MQSFARNEVASPALVNRLYDEAVDLADEARNYFALNGKPDRLRLGAVDRVVYTCECLRISTRLMHVISWLLSRKAIAAGEIPAEDGLSEERRLGDVELCRHTPRDHLRRVPPMISALSLRSQALFNRAWRMECDLIKAADQGTGARALLRQLERSY